MKDDEFIPQTKEDFIAWHLLTCTAGRAKKYDPEKSGNAVHSLDYSRRKCAKNIWRKMQRAKSFTGGTAKEG